ncbi:MAG: NUDIX hydrolase [Rhodospirillaceae bacterium]
MKAVFAFIYRTTPVWITRVLLRAVNPTFSIGAAGVFLTPDGRVLVQRHVYRHQYPWGLPSGFLERGETPEQGALRELSEEVGLKAEVEGIIGSYFIHPRHLEVAVKGTIDPAQLPRLSHEIFELAYVAPDALPQAMPAEQKEMVGRAARGAPAIKTLSRVP